MHRRQLVFSAAALVLLALPAGPAIAASATRRLRFSLALSNPGGEALGTQQFLCYLPANLERGQKLRSVDLAAPHKLQTDRLGHNWLELNLDSFPPYGRKQLGLTVTVDIANESMPSPPVQPGEWLRTERYIETSHPSIQALAQQLNAAAPLATARAIFEWVRDNLNYAGYLSDDYGALYALEHRRGDCTEYAQLVAALARASGIPSRVLGGYVAPRDMAPVPGDYHNWAELYIDGAWRVVDAQKQAWLEPAGDYVGFRICSDTPVNALGLAHRFAVRGSLRAEL
ncbi:transglutaminase-like domain-containing protein [Pseudoduganella sp. R-34]|uniref:transglutaminase-like domain-containing protein n=1 Tax=Pseudoduganella sp. R-34 TaxID=3404062 RepID=UPI003CFAF847